jgi:cysteine desulfurase
LETIGFEVEYLPVQADGLLDLEVLQKAVRQDTILVSVMYANNEIGVIQPIREIAEIAHSVGAVFFMDATQAFGKIPIDVNAEGIDLLTYSGHKIYAPKGIGGLYIRNRLKIEAQQHGGGHERGFRSGTLNGPAVVGLGKAAEIAKAEMKNNALQISTLRDYLETELLKIAGTTVNGNQERRLYNTSNMRFEGVDADALLTALETICVAKGSACTSAIVEPSHVLKALGLQAEESYQSLRFSLGKYNTKEEIEITIDRLKFLIADFQAMTF